MFFLGLCFRVRTEPPVLAIRGGPGEGGYAHSGGTPPRAKTCHFVSGMSWLIVNNFTYEQLSHCQGFYLAMSFTIRIFSVGALLYIISPCHIVIVYNPPHHWLCRL